MNNNEKSKQWWQNNTFQRVISACIMTIVFCGAAFLGSQYFLALLLLGSLIIFYEWVRITSGGFYTRLGIDSRLMFLFFSVVMILFYYAEYAAMMGIFVFAPIALRVVVSLRDRMQPISGDFYSNTNRANWVTFGWYYIGLAFISIIYIYTFAGIGFFFFIAWQCWTTDTGAWFFGRIIGGRKLMPSVSPKKTISGSIGGFALTILMGILINYIFDWNDLIEIIFYSSIISVSTQIGDLVESYVKRRFMVKDASNIIPGHGGLLDRVDGLILAVIVVSMINVSIDLIG